MKRLLFISILFLLSVAIQAQPLVPWKYTPNIQTDSIKVAQYFRLNGEVFKITSASDGQILQRKIVSGKHIWTNVSSTSLGYDSLRFDPGTGYISGYKGGTSNSESTTLLDGRWVLIDVFLDSIAAIRGMTPIGFMLKSEYDPANLSGQIVNINSAQTLTNKTLTQPAIADYTLGQHNHSNTVNGGLVNSDVIVEGTINLFSPFTESAGNFILPSGNLGLGVSPSTKLDVSGTTKTTSLDLNTSLIFDGTTITDIQTGTGTNIALATKNYVDDQIISAGGYTDEQAQDAVGGALDNGTIGDVVFTYNDATPKISGEVENDSHAHTGSTISGLSVSNFTSPNISNWTNNSNYLTSSYALTNDLGGTLSNPAVIDDSHNHTTATLPGIDLLSSGIVTITPNYGANTLTIGATEVDGSVSNEIQNLGYTASTRVLSIDGTGSTDATLPLFTSTEPGLVPLSGGGTSNFLRADGTWAAASGGSSQWTTDTYGITYANNVGIGQSSNDTRKLNVYTTSDLYAGYFYNSTTGMTGIGVYASDKIIDAWNSTGTVNAFTAKASGAVNMPALPAGTTSNIVYFNTTTGALTYGANSGGTGMVNPMTTTGDLIYSNSGSNPARLGIGSTGQVLTVSGGVPSWQNSSSGFADPMTTRGDIIYRNASNITARLGRGTAGQVLSSNGTDISWTTLSAGSGTVTSVGLALPSIFNVTVPTVITTGTLTASLASQTANTVFAAPNGTSGTPSFRKILVDDLSTTGTPSSTTYLRGDFTWGTPSGTSQWNNDTYGINYTSGNVGIGASSNTSVGLTVEKSLASGNSGYFYNTSSSGAGINSIITTATDLYYGLKVRANFADRLLFTGAGTIEQIEQASSPTTPATGYARWYTKTDGKPYFKNDSGTEYDLAASGSGTLPTGSGIPIIVSGTTWGTTITDNSTNWNTAYTNMGQVKLFGTSTYGNLSTVYFEWNTNSIQVKRDGSPNESSLLPITSGGVFTALALKMDKTTVQALSPTTGSITYNVSSGTDATLAISGNSTIEFINLVSGTTGNLTVTCTGTQRTLNFTHASIPIHISPAIWSSTTSTTNKYVLTSGTNLIKDVYSWYYNGTEIIINGTIGYK